MSGPAPYGFKLAPTRLHDVRTKMLIVNPETQKNALLMFEMYAEPETSFGDITRYFSESGIKIYGKELTRGYLSQLLRNPAYAMADLDLYEFFKRQGTYIVNEAADFEGGTGCYLYQGRDVEENKYTQLRDQILVLAPHKGFAPSSIWIQCRKKLMNNTTFQSGRKARNTWMAGKVKCGRCGYALMRVGNPTGTQYLRCSKRADNKSCEGCGTLKTHDFETFIFGEMAKKLNQFESLVGRDENRADPRITALQIELTKVEDEIEKLLDTLTGANSILFSYANSKIETLDAKRQNLVKEIADLSAEVISPKQIKELSHHIQNWEHVSFEDRRKVIDGLITQIRATNEFVQIKWKI